MKRIYKIISLVLAIICSFAIFGCQNQEDTGENELVVVKGLPDYSDDEGTKTLMIGGYCAPLAANVLPQGNPDFINDYHYGLMKEAGLDYILTLYEQGPQDENVKRHLECAKKAGIKVLVRWDAISQLGSTTPETMRSLISEETLNHEAFWGIFAKDEPPASILKTLGSACEVYKQVTDKYFYVNLFPNQADLALLGTKTYQEYVNQYHHYVKNNMVNSDIYPFGHTLGSNDYGVANEFLSQLEVMARYANYYNKEHWEYIQGETCGLSWSKVPDYYDMRMQAYLNMCYGVINMQYFCYFSPFCDVGDMAAFIDGNGERTQRWYDGKKVNDEIHAFDHVYLNFAKNSKGVMTVLGTNNTKGYNLAFDMLKDSISSTPRIKSIKSAEDTVIGTYQDKDGRDGFMIVNYTVPAYRQKNQMEITFNQADSVILYREGKYSLETLTDGKLSLELDAGEGIFAIPVKY